MPAETPEGFPKIRNLELPKFYVIKFENGKLIETDKANLNQMIPWLPGEIELIDSFDWLITENTTALADSQFGSRLHRVYRGSRSDEKLDLPWLDVELSVVIAVNKQHGADLGVALDYRTSMKDPRVVATVWENLPEPHVEWRVVADKASEFFSAMELESSE